MRDLQQLSQTLLELDDKLAACMRCGMCQSVCPLFRTTMKEADVARGKVALIGDLAHSLLHSPEQLGEKLGRCLLCGSCQAQCPSGVELVDIFLAAREAVFTYLGLHPLKKMIFRHILVHPQVFSPLIRMASMGQRVLFKRTQTVQNTVASPLLAPLIGTRHVRQMPAEGLYARCGSLNEPAGKSGLKVAFFPGCMGDRMYPEVSQAVLHVLRHHGVGLFMPRLACCGIPALASGDVQGLLRGMRYNLAALSTEQVDYVVSACPSCTATLKELWPGYAGRISPELQKQAELLAEKAMDISAFLVHVLHVCSDSNGPAQAGAKSEDPMAHSDTPFETVTYHDSCHLKKTLGIVQEPRALVLKNARYRLEEMAEPDACCGCGGSFNLFHYPESRQIGQRKRDQIVATGAELVAASCPACMMQIQGGLDKQAPNIRVKHVAEILADEIDIDQGRQVVATRSSLRLRLRFCVAEGANSLATTRTETQAEQAMHEGR